MKRIISILVLTCCSMVLFAQEHHAFWLDKRYMECWFKPPMDTICCPRKDLPDGKWLFYYDSAMTQLYRVCHQKDGHPIGSWFIFSRKGKPSIITFKGDAFSNEERIYWDNGTLHFLSYSHKGHILFAYDSLGNIVRNTLEEKSDEGRAETIRYMEMFNKPFILDTVVFNNIALWAAVPAYMLELYVDTKDIYYHYRMRNGQNQVLDVYADIKTNTIKKIEISSGGFSPDVENVVNDDFVLNSGVKLGMTREQLLETKTYNYSIMTEDKILYSIDREGKILYHNERPFYKMYCEFKNDKVSKICLEVL